ncbi:MAG: formylglycine-generating enzyme family protein [Fibrobacterota bacterium]
MKSGVSVVICLVILLFKPAGAIQDLSVIQLGGKYRMKLTTGDVLEGVVEMKNDTSLIIEQDGTPYKFRGTLILKYKLLEAPKKSVQDAAEQNKNGQALSYEDIQKLNNKSQKIDVTITSGTVFRGKIQDVGDETLYLNIDGSVVPIAREIIKQIATAVDDSDKKEKRKTPESRGPLDTVYVFSTKTDEYGKQLPPVVQVGFIKANDAKSLTLETPSGNTLQYEHTQIARVIRHSKSSYESNIQKYAKTLFCDESMSLVDIPPGKTDRPFLKVCVDKYEYPNKKGVPPKGNISFDEAQKLCEQQGKRLCTVEEWQYACSGLEEYTYPYGWVFDEEICNTEGAQKVETSGSRYRCISKFGIYDMTGNIFEWVVGKNNRPMLMGGPYSKCQTISPGVGGTAKPQTGFRCCKSN